MIASSIRKFANRGLLVILGAFILATIASIVFLSYTLTKLDASITGTGESYRSLRLLQKLMINLDDAETGTRGYVITGDPAYLEPYHRSVEELSDTYKAIEGIHNDTATPEQIKQLKVDSTKRMEILMQQIESKQRGDTEGAVAIIAAGEGNRIMERLRNKIDNMEVKSMAAIRDKQIEAHDRVRRAVSVAIALVVFVVGICVVIIWYFQRSIFRERALESTKSEFLSLASHQLRTPATNVKQYIGLLLDGYLGHLTKKQKNALEIAYKNNESEIRIMNDLLDVAKLDLKRIQLRKQRVNIVTVVRQVVKDYRQQAANKGQTLELHAPHELTASVDREYLKGVLEKLVDNAIKYSKDKTHISVRVRANDALGVFEIIVKDQGLGIQKREVPKLFMKFSRIANEFSANSEGSGLGLYWVKQVMALHDGTVEVRTQEGRGSKFIIRAPLG